MLLYYVEKDSTRVHFYCKIREDRNVIVSGREGESFSTCALLRLFLLDSSLESCPTQDARLRISGWFATESVVFWFCRNYFLVQRALFDLFIVAREFSMVAECLSVYSNV